MSEPASIQRARDLSRVGPFDGYIRRMLADGYSDDEVFDQLRRDLGDRLDEPERAWIARISAIRGERIAQGLPHRPSAPEEGYPTVEQIAMVQHTGLRGYGRLAKHFNVSKTTIRRRLGRTK